VIADAGFVVDDPGIAINLFRVTQEAISNAVRHGNASAVRIGLRRPFGSMRLEIEDNGRGLGTAPASKGGLGMHTMRYRAALVGADLSIETGASGGVRVVIALPLSEESETDAIQRTT
jgi:signal transduction histidine kinase